ncbi:hypothetical protein GCM10007972_17340 [Iodidimonas muriae]|uniref:Transcriptional regulator n=1 Tax=Iodidimonas muriae TaxID=261467 RepID=A0ABQ2LE77_9PROT|nr:hypothetical protein [Iodidimonas muriae]GER08205.1 hypothetical protein JCM17843_25150 [Kordiimonadales bacterium JCM 17843]GGO12412.1 hypothetical protein GCM10007972_17340 [Iodidimonas muriae]
MASPYLKRQPRTLHEAQDDRERRRMAYALESASDRSDDADRADLGVLEHPAPTSD